MNRRAKTFIQSCVLLLLAVQAVMPQSKTGTTIGQFLLIEPSARVAGMGNAGVAVADEVMAGYFNPAAYGELANADVQFTHSLWLADITYDYAAAAMKISSGGTLGLSVTALNSGEIDVTTVEQPLGTGERYSVSDIAIGLSYGQKITDKFSAGIECKYLQETIWHSSLSAVAFSLGTLYQITSDGMRLGASICNFGTRAQYSGRDLRIRYDNNTSIYGDNSNLPGEVYTEEYPLPIVFRVGIGYPYKFSDNHQMRFEVDAFHPSDNSESVSMGGEYVFMQSFALRAGYQNLFQTDSEVGLTLGAGLVYELYNSLLRFDYAWAAHGRLGDMHRITVGASF
jgi:long-subunit fatty acid transport protein